MVSERMIAAILVIVDRFIEASVGGLNVFGSLMMNERVAPTTISLKIGGQTNRDLWRLLCRNSALVEIMVLELLLSRQKFGRGGGSRSSGVQEFRSSGVRSSGVRESGVRSQ